MKRTTPQNQKDTGPRIENAPMSCSITSALRAPCCTILESISDGVFTIDLEKRVTSFNRAAEIIRVQFLLSPALDLRYYLLSP